MARTPRHGLLPYPHPVTHRSNNQQPVFLAAQDTRR